MEIALRIETKLPLCFLVDALIYTKYVKDKCTTAIILAPFFTFEYKDYIFIFNFNNLISVSLINLCNFLTSYIM